MIAGVEGGGSMTTYAKLWNYDEGESEAKSKRNVIVFAWFN